MLFINIGFENFRVMKEVGTQVYDEVPEENVFVNVVMDWVDPDIRRSGLK